MTGPLLDPAALARLRRIGGEKLVRAMIDSFAANGAARITSAREAAIAGDGQGVSDAAHALKSSAGNLGAESLRLVAQRVEREAVDSGSDLGRLSDELAAAFEQARAAALAARDTAAEG